MEAPMTPAQVDEAVRLVRAVFRIFHLHFTGWEALARAGANQAREGGCWPTPVRPALEGSAVGEASLRPLPEVRPNVSAYMALDYPAYATAPELGHPAGRALASALRQGYDALWAMPFPAWVRDPAAWGGDFRSLKRAVLLSWIVEAWAGADFFLFDATYTTDDDDAASPATEQATPLTPLQRGINRLAALYAAEQQRRLLEWDLLNLDSAAHTGWTSLADALACYWLHPEVQHHRAALAQLRKLALRFPAPLHRYWILKAFVRLEDALIHSLGVAMRAADVPELDDNFVMVAGQAERIHPDLPPDDEADRAVAEVELAPLPDREFKIIRDDIIPEDMSVEVQRLELSWDSIVSHCDGTVSDELVVPILAQLAETTISASAASASGLPLPSRAIAMDSRVTVGAA